MVWATLRAPAAGLYIIQDVCELEPSTDPARLREAWHKLAQRHAALRTRIEITSQHEPRKIIAPNQEYEWSEEDWSGLPDAQLSAELDSFLERDRERGFSWTEGVPMRFTFLRIADRKTILIWTVHHVLLDGRSLTELWREWLAECAGSSMAAVPEYAPDRAAQPAEAAEEYWRDYLGGIARTTNFITDRLLRSGPEPPREMGREKVSLTAEETEAAHELARRHGFTTHTLVQAAWALLLSRYSSTDDVVFGVTRSVRKSDSGVPGMWINTLPLRVKIERGAWAVDFLQSLRTQWQSQRTFATTPLGNACRWGGLPPGAAPFDTLLIYDYASPIDTLRHIDASWKQRTLRRVQKTDAALTVAAYAGPELNIELIYDQRLYCQETMRPLAGHLLELLRGLVAQPETSVAALNMLTVGERRWLLEDTNQTSVQISKDLCAQHLFEQQAASLPRQTAIEWSGGSMTYAELNRQANRIAWRLMKLGAMPDDLIAVSLDRSPLAIAAMLAIFKAGAAFLALPKDLPEERLSGMLETSRPKLVIAEDNRREWFAARGCVVVHAETEVEARDENPASRAGIDHAAYAVFTSGSTGKPKAAVVTHRGMVNYIAGATAKFGITHRDRRLQFAPMGTDVFIAEICGCLSRGATLVMYPPEAGRTIGEYLRILHDRRITLASVASSWAAEWVAAIERGAELPQSLRAVVVGMERLQPAAFETWRKIAKRRLRWFNAYGPSETSGVATVYEIRTSVWEKSGHVPIGTPLANVRTYVLDGGAAPVPIGFVGELYVGGEGVGRGYLNAPESEMSRFQADPFHTDGPGKMYRTGDLVYRLPDGNLVFVGRADRQVKIRGFRIELEEIEAVLAAHAGVRHCAVVLHGAEDRQKLAAYVEPVPGATTSPSEVSAYLKRRLPAHMLPAGIMLLQKMPTTPGGKIDRQSLPPFEPATEHTGTIAQEPATSLERLLVNLWREALDITNVEPSHDFFERGGNSLAATRLIVLVQKHLGRELPVAALMRAPSPSQMAALLEDAGADLGAASAQGPFVDLKPAGSSLPLICITTSTDGPRCFERLAWRLPPEQRFLVLPVVDSKPKHDGAVARLANVACKTLRSAMPKGPYILGGYCLGGVVAYAVAQMLCAAGGDVRLVVLFDSAVPGNPKILRSVQGYLQQTGEWLRGRAAFTARDVRKHLKMMTRAKNKRRRSKLEKAHFPVVQFIARHERVTTRVWEDPRFGWRDLCAGGLDFFEINASHGNLFEGEAAQQIAAHLDEQLQRAGAAKASPASDRSTAKPSARNEQ